MSTYTVENIAVFYYHNITIPPTFPVIVLEIPNFHEHIKAIPPILSIFVFIFLHCDAIKFIIFLG